MTPDEEALARELQNSPVFDALLRARISESTLTLIKQFWRHGYIVGRRDGVEQARKIISEELKHVQRP